MRRRVRRSQVRQLDMFERGSWGGRRPGAGRKKAKFRKSVAHRTRDVHKAKNPVHVTLRSVRSGLRQKTILSLVKQAVRRVRERGDFRVVEYSLQGNHLHMIVEAEGGDALGRAMGGFASGIARKRNR